MSDLADAAPNLSLHAFGATPDQAEIIFEAAMDAAFEAAAEFDGVSLAGGATLNPGGEGAR